MDDWLICGNEPFSFFSKGYLVFVRYLNNGIESAIHTSKDCNFETKSSPACLNRMGASKVETLSPIKMVRTSCFVFTFACSIDPDMKVKKLSKVKCKSTVGRIYPL